MQEPKEIKPGVYDWSTVHQGATDELFTSPKGAQWQQHALSADHVTQFWDQGYLPNIRVLTTEQCDKILQEYDYFTGDVRHPGHELLYQYTSNQSNDPNNVLMHALGHWRVTPLLHDLVFHPRVVAACSQLMTEGAEKAVRFWHDQLFAKPARVGGIVAWHQDYSYWTRTTPCQHVTVHIALDDQTEENGCLQYLPGSHRWTRDGAPLPITSMDFADMESIKTVLTPDELANFSPKPSLLRKGEASFHHAMCVHGSHGNRSPNPRRAAVLNYFADGVLSNGDTNLLADPDMPPGAPERYTAANIPKGRKMEGQLFPLVYDPLWTQTATQT